MNLPENTTYNTTGMQPSIANLSSLLKNIQQNTQNKVAGNIQSALTSNFDPERAAGIFIPPQQTTVSEGTGTFPIGAPIGAQQEGAKFEDIPEYAQFVQPDERNLWALPSDQAQSRNLPENLFDGGQYTVDPTQPGALIKSQRVLVNETINPGVRKALLGKLASSLHQVDHMVPLWAGGTDTLANLTVLDNETHNKKTAIQSVPLTLLANNKITLNEARMMALSWQDKDARGLPTPDNYGYVPLDIAEKYVQKWKEDSKKIETGKYFRESLTETMGAFGKGWLPTPIREFAKGLVGGGTAGIMPGTGVSEESGTTGTISNTAGHIVGTITGLGLLSKGVGLAFRGSKALLGLNKAVSLTNEAMKTAGLAVDIGSLTAKGVAATKRAETLTKMVKTAGLLSLWGQIGLTGREITDKKVDAELKNHMTQFFTDVAFGGLLGASGQSIRGYATVGIGTAALSVLSGEEIVPALQNAALMVALHGMGYKRGLLDPKIRIGNEEAYKMSVTTINQYIKKGIIPPVKVGQKAPETLKLEPSVIEQIRTDYKQKYPNDTRFDTLESTDSGGAIQILGRDARKNFMDSVIKDDGKIPLKDIKKELERITVAENQLYNQTLQPKARTQKEIQDLLSLGEKLRPQISSEQLRYTTNTTKLLNEIPFKLPEQIFENPQGIKFLEGNVPSTGYGGKVDVRSKQKINDSHKNPQNYSNKVFIVKDVETTQLMKLIEQEQIAKGMQPNVGVPEDALRIFMKTKDGKVEPAGYIPREESFDIKANNLNKTYYEITNRLRHIIETAETPEKLMTSLNKDQAKISIDTTTAQKLFERKTTLKEMSDEELYSILKPVNAVEKYDSALNNSAISAEMEKHGLRVLVVDKDKLLPIGNAIARKNPDNPYLSLNLNEQDWLRSIALKTKKPLIPEQQGIKNIINKQEATKVSKVTNAIVKNYQKLTETITKEPIIFDESKKSNDFLQNKVDIGKIKVKGMEPKTTTKILPKLETPIKKPKTIALIGTAGRDKNVQMTKETWDNMLSDAKKRVNSGDTAISGGAAWSDHLAVKLYLDGNIANLKLRLPAPIDKKTGKFKGGYKTSGGVANFYHDKFSKITGIDPYTEINAAIKKGADVTYESEGGGYGSLFARNKKVANEADSVLAYTYGEGKIPNDGGTKNTWDMIKTKLKTHVPIGNLSKPKTTIENSPKLDIPNKGFYIKQDVRKPIPVSKQISLALKTPIEKIKNAANLLALEKSKIFKQSIVGKQPDLVNHIFREIKHRIDYIKPNISSAKQNETQLMGVVNSFKGKNPGLPATEYQQILNMAKNRAKAYVENVIDTTWKGTEIFGQSGQFYTREKISDSKNVLIRRLTELLTKQKRAQKEPETQDLLSMPEPLTKGEKLEIKDLKTKVERYTELESNTRAIISKSTKEQRPLSEFEEKILKKLNQLRFTLTQDYRGSKDIGLVLSNKFGLEIKEPNQFGIRYLKFDKTGQPMFTKEFKESNKEIGNQSPVSFWGSAFKLEIEAYKKDCSKISREWASGIEKMKQSKDPYAKAFATAFDVAMNKKYTTTNKKTGQITQWKDSWKANSAIKQGTRDFFDQTNIEGYYRSQPFRAIEASVGEWPRFKGRVEEANIKTKKITQEAEMARLDRMLENTKEYETKDSEGFEDNIYRDLKEQDSRFTQKEQKEFEQQKLGAEDRVQMRTKDTSQIRDVMEDITPFDLMLSGLSRMEVRNNLINQYNNGLRIEMDMSSAKFKIETLKQMKELFNRIKALSTNIPEVKTWKLDSKITLKNEGQPTAEEGIQDAMHIAYIIFKAKPSPISVKYKNIKETVLQTLANQQNLDSQNRLPIIAE